MSGYPVPSEMGEIEGVNKRRLSITTIRAEMVHVGGNIMHRWRIVLVDNVVSILLSLSNHLPLHNGESSSEDEENSCLTRNKKKVPCTRPSKIRRSRSLHLKCLNFSGNIKPKKKEVENKQIKILR